MFISLNRLRTSLFRMAGLSCLFISILFCFSSYIYSRSSSTKIIEQSKRFDDPTAISFLIKNSKKNVRDYRVYFRIAYLYQKMNRRPEAFVYYKKTLRYRRCHSRALNNLGNIYLDRQEFKKAKSHYLRSIRCNANQINAHYNLGNVYRKEGANKKSISHYKKALSLSPKHYKAHHNLGLVYMKLLKNTQENNIKQKSFFSKKTMFHFSKSLSIKKHDVYSLYNRGRYFQLIGDRKKALADYKRAHGLLAAGSRFRILVSKKIQSLRYTL